MRINKQNEKASIIKKAVATTARMATTINVNSTCAFVVHQPKLPKGAEKLRKF